MKYFKHAVKVFIALALIAAGVMLLKSGKDVPLGVEDDALVLPPMRTVQMKKEFKDLNFDAFKAAENKIPVPRIFSVSIPKDFNRSQFDDDRKALFYNILMPAVLRVNAEVEQERSRLMSFEREFSRTNKLPPAYIEEAHRIAKKYDTDNEDLSTLFAQTKLRVDSVPASLLTALAAEISGWGTNAYARKYNALFLEKSWDGTGIPAAEKQKEGPQYKIKPFNSVYDAVKSFVFYLNTGSYFHPFRISRTVFRREGDKIRGYTAASQLMNYPDKPLEYPDILKHLMEQNKMMPLDFAELDADMPDFSQKDP